MSAELNDKPLYLLTFQFHLNDSSIQKDQQTVSLWQKIKIEIKKSVEDEAHINKVWSQWSRFASIKNVASN